MNSKIRQTLIAAVVQLILLAVFGAVVFFALATEFFVTKPLVILIPALVVMCIINFIALAMIYRKN